MGSFPEHRVQPTLRLFVNTVVDYCGPILINRGDRSLFRDEGSKFGAGI